MANIELIYDADCPNAGQARTNLRRALEMAGLPAHWREWIRAESKTPGHLRRFGSPTILVDGTDVAGEQPLDGSGACRIYQDEGTQRQGVPGVSTILAAVREAQEQGAAQHTRAGLCRAALVPGNRVSLEGAVPAADHRSPSWDRPRSTCAWRWSAERVWTPGPGQRGVDRGAARKVPLRPSVDRQPGSGVDSCCVGVERLAQEGCTTLLPRMRNGS